MNQLLQQSACDSLIYTSQQLAQWSLTTASVYRISSSAVSVSWGPCLASTSACTAHRGAAHRGAAGGAGVGRGRLGWQRPARPHITNRAHLPHPQGRLCLSRCACMPPECEVPATVFPHGKNTLHVLQAAHLLRPQARLGLGVRLQVPKNAGQTGGRRVVARKQQGQHAVSGRVTAQTGPGMHARET